MPEARRPGRKILRAQFISAVVLMQLVLSALALAAVFSGASHSVYSMVFVTICFAIGLATLVWYSATWRDDISDVEAASTGEQPIDSSRPGEDVIAAKRKVAELLRELEDARKEIHDLKAFKSDFLGHISHEIRTPLNAVVGMAELLSRTELKPDQHELVSLVSSSGETLLSVINDILNYSKMEAGEFELECTEFELSELVENTAQLLADQARLKDVSLTTFVSPTLSASYMGDPGRLKQILLNLLGNAVRFAQRGEILISALEDPDNKEFVRLSVKDSSSSITNSVVASLFTPMTEVDMITARKYGGTGLGLSVSKKLVELMKGRIGVDSEDENGTVYWFSAQLRPAPAYHSDETPDNAHMPVKKIMMLGKASSSMAVVMAYSKSWGLDCEYQPNAASALHYLLKYSDKYQAVVVDPSFETEEVIEFLKQMFAAEELADVHALILTDDEETEQSIKKLGFSLLTLRKPFRKAHLREALRQCQLRLRRTGEIERPESLAKSFVASVGFAINPSKAAADQNGVTAKEHTDNKILIVEDNPVNRRLVHLQLKTLGLDCDIVENGKEAVEALQEQRYDLIFMDCLMPILDGFAATAQIRALDTKKGRHTNIVAMTANALDTDRSECLAAGMDDYLSKPVTRAKLDEMVNKWLPARREMKFDASESPEHAKISPVEKSSERTKEAAKTSQEEKGSGENSEGNSDKGDQVDEGDDSDAPPKKRLNTNTWS